MANSHAHDLSVINATRGTMRRRHYATQLRQFSCEQYRLSFRDIIVQGIFNMDFPDSCAIPIVDWPSNAGGYSGIAVDLGDLRSDEALVALPPFGIACESYYARTDGGNAPYNCRIDGSLETVWLRRALAERLLRANAILRPFNAEVLVWDGYRPIETQKGLWSFFWERSLEEEPDASPDRRRMRVLEFVSDPMRFDRSDPTTWPAHSTGGAVDLTLRDRWTGEPLEMGASFDEMSEVSHSDHFERALLRGDIDGRNTALRNRRLLHWAMNEVGLLNYPCEFWHFDWGNQMYVHNLRTKGQAAPEAAWYGYTDLPRGGEEWIEADGADGLPGKAGTGLASGLPGHKEMNAIRNP